MCKELTRRERASVEWGSPGGPRVKDVMDPRWRLCAPSPGSGLPPGQGEGNSLARNSRGLDSPGSRQKKQEVHLGFRNCTPAKDTTGEGSGQGVGFGVKCPGLNWLCPVLDL